ncbi:MAG: CoA-binding protein [Gemmatimonadota bacterium]|jgi:predicted CoA-binding protein
MEDWQKELVDNDDGLRRVLQDAHRIAVLGIKPESRADRAAYYVPAYLQKHGYEIVPVPVYYPDVTEILGQPVFRALADVPGNIDLVDVFRRPEDIPPHVPDILAVKPRYVWFQLGIRNDAAARELAEAGIEVVQDRCMLADHRRLFG